MTDRMDINNLLSEMRNIKAQTQAFQKPSALADNETGLAPGQTSKVENNTPSFTELMEQAVNSVNEVQKQSGALRTAYEQGDPNVDITEVMIASQKASVSFQSMLQVRNKLVEAYRDVMNMPV